MKDTIKISHVEKFIILSAFCLFFTGCNIKTVRSAVDTNKVEVNGTGEDETSFKSDREALEKLRSEVPEDIKKHNDEIGEILSYIYRDSEEEPNRLRDRFQNAVRHRREAMNKKLRISRDAFSKEERLQREGFLKKNKEERDRYLSKKHSADERKDFFSDQEDRRKSFFAEERDRRKEFESRIQEERKAFDDFSKEKQALFNQEWRQYQARYIERRRRQNEKKKLITPGTQPVAAPAALPAWSLDEFNHIPNVPAIPLTPDDK